MATSLPTILRACPDATWTVIGYGDDLPELRRYCLRLGVEDRIAFRGHVDDDELIRAYRSAAVLALPSVADADATPPTGEGFGLVYAEAASFGVPSIASTAGGGSADLVLHGRTGLTVPPGDSTALAETVIQLLDDRELRSRLGSAARARVLKHHTPDRFAAALRKALD